MRRRTISRLIRKLHGSVGMLLFVRKALLVWAKGFITRKLNGTPNLEGDLEEIDIRFLQGVVVLRGIHFARLSSGRRLFEAKCSEVLIHFEWGELLRGILAGRIHLSKPQVGIFADRERDGDKNPPADALLALRRDTQRYLPFHLRSLEASDGRIDYVSHFTSPPFELAMEEVSLSATGLSNIDPGAMAQVDVEGRTTGHGRFWMRLRLPSLADTLTFNLQGELNQVNLVDWNDALRALARFDVKRGICSIRAEFQVERGRYRGVIRPRFQNLDVFAWQKEHGKGFFQICRQAAIAFFASVFKNQPRDQLVVDIPVSGTFGGADVDVWAAVGSLLKNAFVHSLFPPSANGSSATETKRRPGHRFWERKQA